MLITLFFLKFHRKYRVKYSEKQQKIRKNHFFIEKNMLQDLFCTDKQIFLVILHTKSGKKTIVANHPFKKVKQ